MVENLYAMAGTPQDGGNPFLSFLPLILIVAIMYFLILRPQSKKQKERQRMIEALQKGDKVVTAGGIHGKIVGFKNDNKVVILKVDDNVKLELDRTSISGAISKPEKK